MINLDLTGYCLINNEDAWTKYSLGFEQGTFPELLKAPKRKDQYARVWADKSGTQRFSKNIFFESKTLSLPVFIIGTDKDDLAVKYSAFKSFMETSGYFTLEFPDLGKNYKLLYDDMPDFNFETAYTKDGNVVARFKLSLTDDFPIDHSIFRAAFESAKAAGYTVDSQMFDQAVSADLPYSYQKEAEVILAPGISKIGKVAGIDRNGGLVEFLATRAGTATYIGKDGLLKTAAANEPRIDWSDGIAKLLIEPAAVNRLVWSGDLTKPGWKATTSIITVSSNAAISPTGENNGNLVTVQAGSGAQLYYELTLTAGSIYTFSAYINTLTKNGGYSLKVINSDGTVIIVPKYDYSSQLAEGFSRITQTFTVPSGVTAVRVYLLDETASIGGTFAVYGCQIEDGSYVSSQIPTAGSSVVRSADTIVSVSTNLLTGNAASVFFNAETLTSPDGLTNLMLVKSNGARYFYEGGAIMHCYDLALIGSVQISNDKSMFVSDMDHKSIFNGGIKGDISSVDTGVMFGSGTLQMSTSRYPMRVCTLAFFSRKLADQESIDLTK